MRKIYKLCIGIALSAIIVACADKLDSDKYFKDRRSLEDVFTDKENTEEWLAHAYSFLNGYNLEVSMMLNTITNFADDIYFGGNSLAVYKEFKTGTYDDKLHTFNCMIYFHNVRQQVHTKRVAKLDLR